MTENLKTGFDSEPSKTDIRELNLDIKRHLLAHKPLGRTLISPKFLLPLGAKSLSNFDSSIFLNSETNDSHILDNESQNSPFLSKSKSKSLNSSNLAEANKTKKSTSNSTIIQAQIDSHDSMASPKIENLVNTASENIFLPSKKAEQTSHEKAETPQLPKALQNISIFNHLSQSSDLVLSTVADEIDSLDVSHPVPISHTPAHHIQKKPEQDIPDSWSSIAELFGESKVDSISSTMVVQPLRDKKQWNNKLKPLQHIKTLNNETFGQVIQASPKTSTSAESMEDNYSNLWTNKYSASENELENLETLAREIYKMLKQRLEIEGERRGNNYSGRLPW